MCIRDSTYRIHLDNGTTAVLNIAVIDSGAEPVEPIDAILSQPTWTGASANADETNALIEKLWTPIEEDGYGIFSFEEDSYTLTKMCIRDRYSDAGPHCY